jgi:tetratricopeptide (TPR) repeat protein/outer membrane protein OmpA-like peptidoglycan-associated protein
MSRLPLIHSIALIGCFWLMSGWADAQTAGQYIAKGDKEFKDGYHQSALFYYKKALGIDTQFLEANFKAGEAYRVLRNYKRAADFYEACIDYDGQDMYTDAHLYLGLMLKQQGKYQQAINRWKVFQSIYRARDEKYRLARDEIISTEWAIEHQNDTADYEVNRPDSGLNTRHAELSPYLLNDTTMFFSTMRYEKDEVRKSNPVFIEVKVARKDSTAWEMIEIPSSMQMNDLHVGNTSFTPDGAGCYFSVCSSLGACEIYLTRLQEDGTWTEAQILPAPVNDGVSNNTQPTVIDYDDEQYLVFASNRERGKGGMDLWFVTLKDGEPTARIRNLGANVNTEGDEITPFFDHGDSTLFFSSNRLNGFGGFDIFRFDGLPGSRNAPENLGPEVNTPADDYYFMGRLSDSLYQLASNRKGGIKKQGNETCCNDIYQAKPIIEEEVIAIPPEDTITPIDSLLAGEVDSLDPSNDVALNAESPVEEIEQPKNIEELQTLLPIALYFHNDEPDPRTLATSTKKSYPETIVSYLNLQDAYVDALNASDLAADDKLALGDQMQAFFERDLDRSLEQLDKALRVLLQELEDSNRVNLAVKGYASTLASSDYNLNLTLRRISSMENYLRTYANGAFVPYLNAGSLQIERIPYGESQANQDVSDDAADALGSIYNPKAARERRIEILKVERQE